VSLEIGEDAVAPLGAQAREGVAQRLLVNLLRHAPIIREP
jgi:hypothetical protein